MKRMLWTNALALAAVAMAAEPPAAGVDTAAAFSRLKALAGEWRGETQMGTATLKYEVIAGGTAVVEHETAANMPEMLTVYHMDGKRLLLTHYCMAGNQPRMEAQSYDPASGEVQFRFLDATNLAAGGGHMHNAKLRMLDASHLKTEWQFYENGRLKMSESAEYQRVR